MNARLWVLNLSDGKHSLLDIAERARLPFPVILDAAVVLRDSGLLEPVAENLHEKIEEMAQKKPAPIS